MEMELIKSKTDADNLLESVDRISALPDSILGVILSLLPTKNALATSTLSKRWSFVWRFVHNLDFCHYSYVDGVDSVDENIKFVGLVNHVLFHHDAGVLNMFRLKWGSDCIQFHATSWIETAVMRNVRQISLCLECCYAWFSIPMSVFSCESLRSLELGGQTLISASAVFCLPRLENLGLSGVRFESEEVFERIIRGCPVLNHLCIIMEGDDSSEFRFIISSTSLRRLELHLGYHKYLKLDASSLEYLKLYAADISVDFVQQKLCSLVEVDLGIIYYDDDDICKTGILNSMIDALGVLERTKILTVSYRVMQTLSCGTRSLSTDFTRLVKLETTITCCRWSSLQDFIQRSNNLEVITICKHLMSLNDGSEHDHSNCTSPVEVPRCLSTSLKKVVLNGYWGYEDEREMLGYILKHGSALEVVEILFREEINGSMSERVQEILEYPRMSDVCKFNFPRRTSKGIHEVRAGMPI